VATALPSRQFAQHLNGCIQGRNLINANIVRSGLASHWLARCINEHTPERNATSASIVRSGLENQVIARNMKEHTGEKRYQGKHCGKFFGCSSTCKIHERTHTDGKTYEWQALQCYLALYQLARDMK